MFYDELQQCLPSESNTKIIWIESALHADLDRLELELKTALAEAEAASAEVQMFLGVGCHSDMMRLARKHDARISPVKNCLEAFVGPKLGNWKKMER